MSNLSNVSIDHSERVDYFRKFDYLLLSAVLAVTALGMIYLSSAQYDKYVDHGQRQMLVQIIGLTIGIMLCIAFTFFDYRNFKKVYIPFYIVNLLLMLAVFVPGIGIDSGGSRSWLNIGITTYQPSELMKLAMVIYEAVYLEKVKREGMTVKYALHIILGFGIPLALVFLQKDLGMAITYIITFMVVIFVGEIKLRYLFGALAAGAIGVPFIWKFYMNGTRRTRLLGFLDPSNELYYDYTLQLRRSLTAIGNGGVYGQGLGEGTMNRSNKILVKLTDMIYSVVCEEGGFIIAVAVIILFGVILLRMLSVSIRSQDYFGRCVAAGIFASFFVVIVQNIAMNLGLLPITGLALPFMSQGGSAMLANYISVGMVMSISMRREKGFFSG
ncbi:MAG: FtsW/RodA/SpoVE family cell cycle protein [Clostridia bacterium]|nr:FtsW/RodA/SpoVE family cell cycle protein [Clostridia bacterium]